MIGVRWPVTAAPSDKPLAARALWKAQKYWSLRRRRLRIPDRQQSAAGGARDQLDSRRTAEGIASTSIGQGIDTDGGDGT
ncbi:hypothetical protein CQW49_07185 [Methylosinus trichosporium OB3b]|uniref:Uncharacterized protein n=1 Tax=Methylosinus trichosporium (strain ATCC 35070 / NCIMB 11131 / UNIQEM 75 / OB3b) TaxID=595536 RepID=A0A2D2CYA2_METT3|nr:hypothetical protein CQW49_07185 [Methylosinus trichosporium OB3b]OBS53631.1 hypothetical protein A8B73_04720 [Methylosinus sp. 3S-1]